MRLQHLSQVENFWRWAWRPANCRAVADAHLLAAEALCVGYDAGGVLPPITWHIRRGQIWALIGKNGSGKSTLLRTLLRLLPPLGGTVTWAPHLAIAYLAQQTYHDAALPMRVMDYVVGGAERGYSFLWPGGVRRCQAELAVLAQALDFANLLQCPFCQLSAGQQQRVALARTLMGRPDLLVLDEPTSAMDTTAEKTLFSRLPVLATDRKLAVLVVGHHLQTLLAVSTHWAFMQNKPGLFVAGPRRQVMQDPTFCLRYGELFTPDFPEDGAASPRTPWRPLQ